MQTTAAGSQGRSRLRQLVVVVSSFIVAGAVLNAGGIAAWAQRLPIDESPVLRSWLVGTSESWLEILKPTALPLAREHLRQWRGPAAGPADAPRASAGTRSEPMSGREGPGGDSSPTTPPLAGDPVTAIRSVVLVGDSMMAVSLGPHLARELKLAGASQVIRAYRSATGLARPEAFDWMAEYPRLLSESTPDLVICAIGANDAQGMQVDRRIYRFGQADWFDEYARRVERFLDLLQARGSRVVWVLLPPMRSAAFDARMQGINQMMTRRFEGRPGLSFVQPSGPIAGNADAGYVEYAPDTKGRLQRLRAEDGIHLTDEGGRRLARAITAHLQREGLAGQPVSR